MSLYLSSTYFSYWRCFLKADFVSDYSAGRLRLLDPCHRRRLASLVLQQQREAKNAKQQAELTKAALLIQSTECSGAQKAPLRAESAEEEEEEEEEEEGDDDVNGKGDESVTSSCTRHRLRCWLENWEADCLKRRSDLDWWRLERKHLGLVLHDEDPGGVTCAPLLCAHFIYVYCDHFCPFNVFFLLHYR